MTVFWIVAGLLVAAALLFVLPPLLGAGRRKASGPSRDAANLAVLRDQLRELDADLAAGTIDQAQYDRARQDLDERVLEDVQAAPESAPGRPAARRAALAVGVVLPVLAVAVYLAVGNLKGLDPAQVAAEAGGDSHALTPQRIEAMTARLAERLKQNPNDIEGWIMLARSYAAIGRYADAAAAYGRATALVPQDAQLLADYADTVAMAQGRRLDGEPEKIIARALQADPNNLKALALAGTVAFERKDYSGAVAQWQKIVSLVPPDSDIARSIASSISEAQALSGKPAAGPLPAASFPSAAAAAPVPAAPKPAAAAAAAVIKGVVSLDPKLKSQVSANDAVFIFARPAEGPRMPLAVVRKQVKDLPASFTLDDSTSMSPDVRLSSQASVIVGARVSKSGNATPASGDLEGATPPVRLGATDVSVIINSRRN